MANAMDNSGLSAPSIEGLHLLNGRPVDQDSLFESNNVVVFVVLDGSQRIMEELLDDLCRIMDRYQDSGVVALVAFQHYNPMILRTAAGAHSFKRLLISVDEGQTGRVTQRYRSAFKENGHHEATAFLIDKGGKVQWHGDLKDQGFEHSLKRMIADIQDSCPIPD